MHYVCIDLDGVIFNFMGSFKAYVESLGGRCDAIQHYNLGKNDYGIPFTSVKKCFSDSDFYQGMQTFDDAIEGLQLLQVFCKTKAYTCLFSDNSAIWNLRKNFCRQHGLEGTIYLNFKPTDKGASALFEDNLDVCQQWVNDGSDALIFLIDASYNQRTPENEDKFTWSRFIRCSSFHEAVGKYLSGEY